jgi:NAD(P)-dependent dehydrogenase (short-subunit alcohol dehydrogenase family)
VLMSGAVSVRPFGSPAYSACNAALEGLARALARELAPIRVNCFSRRMVDSELWRERPYDVLQPALAQWAKVSVVGRPGSVDEAAAAAAFLLDNGNMTGSTIYFDGGYTVM